MIIPEPKRASAAKSDKIEIVRGAEAAARAPEVLIAET
jgi:hypothetical protein